MWYSPGSSRFGISTPVARRQKFHLRWTTVSYRSVALVVIVIASLAGFILYLLFPEPFRSAGNAVRNTANRGLNRLAGDQPVAPTGSQQAKFTAIEGTVRVKKVNSSTWQTADLRLPLEKGDVVQTSSEGMAKVNFVDGTNYTVKPDSLIVIEENSTSGGQQTQVAVQLTTGTVDLTTGTFSRGSVSQVRVSGATASLSPSSTATARNDPRADLHEIQVKNGSAQVTRGRETVPLGAYDRVTFSSNSATMTKTKEIAPPILIAPANMSPIFVTGASTPVDFTWTPVENAQSYRLRLSRNPYFTSTVIDRRIGMTGTRIAGLSQGAYYWTVRSLDANGKESVESELNRFTVIPKGAEKVGVLLEVDPHNWVQHGRVLEIKGRTEPGAKVIVNNQEVPDVQPDGRFTFFTPQPLPAGENVITITAQNARGGVSTKQATVVIQ